MNILKVDTELIQSIVLTPEKKVVKMSNGNEYIHDIAAFPNLRKGTSEQRENYTIEGAGRWLHWKELDEDLSTDGFVANHR